MKKRKVSLASRIQSYFLKKHSEWINGGEIEALAMGVGHKGSTCGRILRSMSEFEDSFLLKEERKNTNTGVTSIYYKLNERHAHIQTYKVPALNKEVKVYTNGK